MNKKHSKKKLSEDLTKQLIPGIIEKLDALVNEEKRALEIVLQEAQGTAAEEDNTAIIGELLHQSSTFGNALQQHWSEVIREQVASVPEELSWPQSEARFTIFETDSLRIRTGKILKSTFRSIQQGLQSVFRRTSSQSNKWMHKVPVQNILIFHLLELQQWVDSWNKKKNRLLSELFHSLDRWMLSQQGGGEVFELENRNQQPAEQLPETLAEIFANKQDELSEAYKSQQKSLTEIVKKLQASVLQDWELVGTFEQSDELYVEERIRQKEQQYRTALEGKNEKWLTLHAALRKEAEVSLNFVEIKRKMKRKNANLKNHVEQYFDKQLKNPMLSVQQKLREGIEQLESIAAKGEELPPAKAENLQKAITKLIAEDLLQEIDKSLKEQDLALEFEQQREWLLGLADSVAEQTLLLKKMDFEKHPPTFTIEEINWQALVRRILNDKIIKELLPEKVSQDPFLNKLESELSGLKQVVEINLEVTEEVSKKDEEKPIDVGLEGLKRSQNKVDELLDQVDSRKKELLSLLDHQQKEALERLNNLLLTQDTSEVKWAGAQFQAKEKAVDWQTKWAVYYARSVDWMELMMRFMGRKIRFYNTKVGQFLGFEQKKELEEEKADLATYLSQTDEKINRLPFIYRKLFNFKADVDTRFYVRRTEQFDRFKKAYELWQNEFPSALAVIGEKGSGKSSFWQLVKEDILKNEQIITLQIDKTCWTEKEIVEQIARALKIEDVSTAEDLIQKVQNKRKRIAIILEDIQNCYVRNINGYEGIYRLLYLISETNIQILWGVSCSRYAWNFLDKVLNVSDYFTHIAQTDELNGDQIKSVILKRHKSSGYRLQFTADTPTQKSRSYRKLLDDEQASQEYLKEQYFERLGKVAEGNASIAMILWIRSIKDFDDTFFYIEPFYSEAIQRIENLEPPELFTFAAMVLHDMLTPRELSLALNESVQDSKLMISRQVARKILVKEPNGYMLNQLIYRQVLKILKERNLIH